MCFNIQARGTELSSNYNMKKVVFLIIITSFHISLFGQQLKDSTYLKELINRLEICRSIDFNAYYVNEYCNDNKKILRVTIDKSNKITHPTFENIGIYHYVYRNDTIVEINCYKSDFSRPDSGFASHIYTYLDNQTIEQKTIDKDGNLTGDIPILRYVFQDRTIEVTRYDKDDKCICVGPAYSYSTKVYTLDSYDRVIQVDFWCKDQKPYKLISSEKKEYVNDPNDFYYRQYYDTDSVYVVEKTSLYPVYFNYY